MVTVERNGEVAMKLRMMRQARERAKAIKLEHQHFQPRRERPAPKTATGLERRSS